MVKRSPKDNAPKTTAQRLDSIVKSARKIMRKDKGLNGDLDRLPMLTWIMFLKFLDDLERIHEDEAKLAGEKFHPAIEPPYRWRDWAAVSDGITGPDLIRFIAAEEAMRPDGTKGPGLFTYLRELRGRNGGRDRRDVIATMFRGLSNRMESGYLLRDVINLISDIHFDSSEEIHTLSRLYEGLLREMRDAAGDSGEFYTPRPVIRFMVEVINPKLGEIILDPACGTGGFLTEAFTHLAKQANTVQKRELLQKSSIRGGEAKSLPFMLAQMNLLLHGLEAPDIDVGNSLRFKLTEIGEKDRVEVILTNPPFGGEEEAGILTNFPDDRRTSETALLFLQLIMRKLKKAGKGRGAVVVPNGTLFGDGIAARIKADLLENFNLHTIVRLPEGTFEPYTRIPTNLIFFDTSGSTKDIWFYEHPLPEGKKAYSKTQPLQYDELSNCLTWWSDRKEGACAWKVSASSLIKRDEMGRVASVNLDQKNPNAKNATDHRLPAEIIDSIIVKENSVLDLLDTIKRQIISTGRNTIYPLVRLGETIRHRKEFITIDDSTMYKRCRVQVNAKGIALRDRVLGIDIKTKQQQVCRTNEFLVAEIDAKHGGYGVVPKELDGAIVSSHYFLYQVDYNTLLPEFLDWFSKTPFFFEQVSAQGSTNYAAIRPHHVLDYRIPLPPLEIQERAVQQLNSVSSIIKNQKAAIDTEFGALLSSILDETFSNKKLKQKAA